MNIEAHKQQQKKSKLVKNLILSKKLRQLGENKLLSDEHHVEKKKTGQRMTATYDTHGARLTVAGK